LFPNYHAAPKIFPFCTWRRGGNFIFFKGEKMFIFGGLKRWTIAFVSDRTGHAGGALKIKQISPE